jgi:chromosomal replication initiator protein
MTVWVADIQRATASEYNLPFAVMSEPDALGTRIMCHSRPRQTAMYISSCLTQHGYKQLGRMFGGRDHSTVIHAVQVVRKRLANDVAVQDAVRRIARKVLA